MKSNNLTIKQEAFCQSYIKSGDKSAAYREAYSTSNMKTTTIYRKAQELFTNGKVTARIEELQSKVADIAENKFQITSEEMLRHLNILRNARIDEYVEYKKVSVPKYNASGKKTGTTRESRLVFKEFDKLTKEQLMCIESIKQNRYGEVEIKLHGKEWTIKEINRHIGFYEKDNEQSKTSIDLGEGFNEEKQKRIDALIAKATESKNNL